MMLHDALFKIFIETHEMKKLMATLLLFNLMLCGVQLRGSSEAQNYLAHRIPKGNIRYESYIIALDLLHQRDAKTLVETGTARYGDRFFDSDGGSTIIFGHWAWRHDATLHSIDINPRAIDYARAASLPYVSNIRFVSKDSVAILKEFNQPIDFLYLDSFDFEINHPEPSQEHHLKEILAAYPFLHQDSVVMIDDCHLPHGGKGKLVIAFLLEQGWKIHYDGYQTILVR